MGSRARAYHVMYIVKLMVDFLKEAFCCWNLNGCFCVVVLLLLIWPLVALGISNDLHYSQTEVEKFAVFGIY